MLKEEFKKDDEVKVNAYHQMNFVHCVYHSYLNAVLNRPDIFILKPASKRRVEELRKKGKNPLIHLQRALYLDYSSGSNP